MKSEGIGNLSIPFSQNVLKLFHRSIRVSVVRLLSVVLCVTAVGANAIFELGDYNGDGRDDFIFVRDQDYVCRLSQESGVSSQEIVISNMPTPPEWHLAAQGDFNGDGNTDFLFRHTDNLWQFVPMEGCSTLESARQDNISIAEDDWRIVGVRDLNADNRDDLVLRDDTGSWLITIMDGAEVLSTVNSPAGLPKDTSWYVIGIDDFDTDEGLDILLKHRNGEWNLATSTDALFTSFLTESVPFEASPAWRDETTADFDGDGSAELLLRHADGSWKVQSSSVNASGEILIEEIAIEYLPEEWSSRTRAIGDVDGDDHSEMILVDETYSLSVHKLDGPMRLEPDRLENVDSELTFPLPPIYIPDLAFRRLINSALNADIDSWIFAEKLGNLLTIQAPYGHTVLDNERIRDLRGLRYASRLMYFNAHGHRIESLQPFIGLSRLSTLNLNAQRLVFNISPLVGSTSLTQLYLDENSLIEVLDLQFLVNLKTLHLRRNRIQDISFLTSLTSLEELYLLSNDISDISAIASLTSLETLRLDDNHIDDLNPISELVSLKTLGLSANAYKRRITDISALRGLVNLSYLNLWDNLVEDLDPLKNLTKLRFLNVSKNRVRNLAPVSNLVNLILLDLRENLVEDITYLEGLIKLEILDLSLNDVKDITVLRSLPNLRTVNLSGNPLSDESNSVLVPSLVENGVSVTNIQELTFKDSRGRHTVYALDQENVDVNGLNGLLIYFHGNVNISSKSYYLVNRLSAIKEIAEQNDLVSVVVISPHGNSELGEFQTPKLSGKSTRSWNYNEDLDLVHEMLQTGFGGQLDIDFSRIYLWGSSQGSCFLNQFMRRWGDRYGGGFYADCGCSEGLDSLWHENAGSGYRWRVLIGATTRDFLHTLSVQAYGYYKYVLGFDTLGDLSYSGGGHCNIGDINDIDTIDWIVNGGSYLDLWRQEEEAYFERVSMLDRVVGMASDRDGALWAVQQERTGETAVATLWRSVDEGGNFELISRINAKVYDLDSADHALFITTSQGDVLRSLDSGRSFSEIEFDSAESSALIPNGVEAPLGWSHVHHTPSLISTKNGTLLAFLKATQASEEDRILVSSDLGDTWRVKSVPSDQNGVLPDPVNLAEDQWYLTLSRPIRYLAEDSDLSWESLNNPVLANGNEGDFSLGSVAWDGRKLLSFGTSPYGPIWSSDDSGFSWDDLTAPTMVTPSFGRYGPAQLIALGYGDVLIIGGGRDGHVYNGNTGEWRHIHGGAAIGIEPLDGDRPSKVAVDSVRGDVYISDGRGIFKLDESFRFGFVEPDDLSDQDADGIPDALDIFPRDNGEYLDTDGDGVGNANDDDDDGDGRMDDQDEVPLDRFEFADLDDDGVGNVSDNDIDGDGIRNALDRFEWDFNESRDSDADGIGNWDDDDDDNDGVIDTEDAFPLYAGETEDADGDFIGDNIDPHPRDSTVTSDENLTYAIGPWSLRRARVLPFTTQPTSGINYPERKDWSTSFASIQLGDSASATIELMLMTNDSVSTQLLYVDRNRNGDLSDDGLEIELENGTPSGIWYHDWVEVEYQAGETLPYTFDVTVESQYENGSVETHLNIYQSGKVTFYNITDEIGYVVAVIDADADGVFNGDEDYVCIDHDHDATFDRCSVNPSSPERFKNGEQIVISDDSYRIAVTASGYRFTLQREASSNSIFTRRIGLQTSDRGNGNDDLDSPAINSEIFEEFPKDWRLKRSMSHD